MEYLNEKNKKETAKLILNGEIVAIPTETVYGLAIVYDSKEAFEKMAEAKKRPADKPFALACSSLDQALNYIDVNEQVESTMRKFLPGQVTFLVNTKKNLPWHVTLGTNVIGIRVPAYDFIRDVIDEVGKPILLTSANYSNCPTSRTYDETLSYFDNKIGGIVKGECTSKVATTIVNLSVDNQISLVREGLIPFEDIKKVWEENE